MYAAPQSKNVVIFKCNIINPLVKKLCLGQNGRFQKVVKKKGGANKTLCKACVKSLWLIEEPPPLGIGSGSVE